MGICGSGGWGPNKAVNSVVQKMRLVLFLVLFFRGILGDEEFLHDYNNGISNAFGRGVRVQSCPETGLAWRFFVFWPRELAQRSRLESVRAQKAQPGHTKGTARA